MTRSDIQRLFRHMPGLFLVLKPDADFTIVGASEDYLQVTRSTDAIFGRPLFDVFPDNPAMPDADGASNLAASLNRVRETGAPDVMPVQRYDLRLPQGLDGGFEERYWTPVNAPVFDEHGALEYLIHRVEDATAKASRDAVTILESITEGFYTLDRQWRFGYVNREAYRILGREPGSLSGQLIWALYPGLQGIEFGRNYERTMHQREKSSFTAF